MFNLTSKSLPPTRPLERAEVAISLFVIEFCFGVILASSPSEDNIKYSVFKAGDRAPSAPDNIPSPKNSDLNQAASSESFDTFTLPSESNVMVASDASSALLPI